MHQGKTKINIYTKNLKEKPNRKLRIEKYNGKSGEWENIKNKRKETEHEKSMGTHTSQK